MKPTLWMLALLFLMPLGLLTAQDNAADADRDLQNVIREQENALRRLKALRSRMERLKTRLAKEGREHSVNLLQKALDELTASGLETRMGEITNKLKLNERLAGLSEAEQVVLKLQSILDLLLEKPETTELDKKLEELDKRRPRGSRTRSRPIRRPRSRRRSRTSAT
jgi:hypothetical protein